MRRERQEGDMEFARELRRSLTTGEHRLWKILRRTNCGYKFRRQHAVGGYVLDFFSPSLMLAFELDGPFHDPAKDAVRDAFFAERGVKTVRLRSMSLFQSDTDVGHFVHGHVSIREQELGLVPPPD